MLVFRGQAVVGPGAGAGGSGGLVAGGCSAWVSARGLAALPEGQAEGQAAQLRVGFLQTLSQAPCNLPQGRLRQVMKTQPKGLRSSLDQKSPEVLRELFFSVPLLKVEPRHPCEHSTVRVLLSQPSWAGAWAGAKT